VPKSSTLTIRVPSAVKDQLSDLAQRTRRTSSFLAAEAVADYVQKELEIVAAVEQGLESARAGRLIDHDDVMREARAVIAKAKPTA
jgi:predicted transcriptional regulator